MNEYQNHYARWRRKKKKKRPHVGWFHSFDILKKTQKCQERKSISGSYSWHLGEEFAWWNILRWFTSSWQWSQNCILICQNSSKHIPWKERLLNISYTSMHKEYLIKVEDNSVMYLRCSPAFVQRTWKCFLKNGQNTIKNFNLFDTRWKSLGGRFSNHKHRHPAYHFIGWKYQHHKRQVVENHSGGPAQSPRGGAHWGCQHLGRLTEIFIWTSFSEEQWSSRSGDDKSRRYQTSE